MSLSANSVVRQGPNTKRTQGRGDGRTGGKPRFQANRNSGQAKRVNGNARQVMEKYLALARDATTAGDRITAEGHFQHAEHYFRLMTGNGSDADQQEHRSAATD